MAASGRAKSLGDVTEGGLGGMEGAINYLKESKGANKEIRDGLAEIGRLIEELQKKNGEKFYCTVCEAEKPKADSSSHPVGWPKYKENNEDNQ